MMIYSDDGCNDSNLDYNGDSDMKYGDDYSDYSNSD